MADSVKENPFDPGLETTMPVRAGSLRTRVLIQKRPTGYNEYGERSSTWTDVATVWASVVPTRGNEQFAAEQHEGVTTFTVKMRYRNDVGPTNRLMFDNGRILDIQSAVNVDRRSEQLELTCLERSVA